ncbi:MAG: helix-turn-helix domain-containing protein [Sulfurospirillaceae bacterium]|nr:helix-turn-helix domain-containing protein [Sulfurospirillaceae bacterium]
MHNKESIKTASGGGISQFELMNLIYKSKLFQKIVLKPTAKLVLYALVHHYNPQNEDMFPSQKFIADSLGVSEKSIERSVKELAANKLIMYVTKKVNRYKFTEHFFDLVKMSDNTRQKVGNDLRQNVGQTYKHEQKKNNNVSTFYKKATITGSIQSKNSIAIKQESEEMLKKIKIESEIHFSPKDYSKKDAKKWLDNLLPELHGGILAQEVYQKYGFKMSEKIREILIQKGKLPALVN